MVAAIEIEDSIIKKLRVIRDDYASSPSQLVNEFIIEVLEEDSKDEMSHEEIQSVLAHDNPGGDNSLKLLRI